MDEWGQWIVVVVVGGGGGGGGVAVRAVLVDRILQTQVWIRYDPVLDETYCYCRGCWVLVLRNGRVDVAVANGFALSMLVLSLLWEMVCDQCCYCSLLWLRWERDRDDPELARDERVMR